MIPIGLFSQIALIILSVMIIFTFVKPKLEEVKTTEDSIAIYQEEQMKVESVNKKLANLKASITAISDTDRRSLLTYMPNKVDTVAVPRDIETIVLAEGALLKNVRDAGEIKEAIGEVSTIAQDMPAAHEFEFSVEGSYDQLKNIFLAFEQNAYPLEIHELHIVELEGGFLQANGKVRTYSRRLSTGTSEFVPLSIQP